MGGSVIRELLALARALPAEFARRLADWVYQAELAPHRPVQVDEREFWCPRDKVPWPCEQFVKVVETHNRMSMGGEGGNGGVGVGGEGGSGGSGNSGGSSGGDGGSGGNYGGDGSNGG